MIADHPAPARALALLLFVTLFSTAITAQTSTGQLSVTVLDPSGAVIPGATVQLKGSDTGNILRTIETNASGTAAIPLIPPGTYDIAVTSAGFKQGIRPRVTVDVGTTGDLSVSVETGSYRSRVRDLGCYRRFAVHVEPGVRLE